MVIQRNSDYQLYFLYMYIKRNKRQIAFIVLSQ